MASRKSGSSRSAKQKRRKERQSDRQRREEQRIPVAIARGVAQSAEKRGSSLPDAAPAIFARLTSNYLRAHPDRDLESWSRSSVVDMFGHYFDSGGNGPAPQRSDVPDVAACVVEFAHFTADRNPESWRPGDLDSVQAEISRHSERMLAGG